MHVLSPKRAIYSCHNAMGISSDYHLCYPAFLMLTLCPHRDLLSELEVQREVHVRKFLAAEAGRERILLPRHQKGPVGVRQRLDLLLSEACIATEFNKKALKFCQYIMLPCFTHHVT